MEKSYMIKECIKMFYICLMSYWVYIKISNHKNSIKKKNIIIVLESVLTSLLYTLLINFIELSYANLISFCVYGMLLNFALKKDFTYFIVSYIISIVIAYMIHLVSTFLAGFLLILTFPTISFTNNIAILIIIPISILIFKVIFSIKRLKNGFNFLNNNNTNKRIIFFTILFSGIVLLLFSVLQKVDGVIRITWLFIAYMLIALSIMFWVKNEITNQYKRNMRDRTIEIQKKEIEEQLHIIENIKDENFKLAKAIHKYNNRLSALELGIKNTIKQNYNTEFAEELNCILKETESISKGFSEETTIKNEVLPLTNVIGIDNMFKYMQKEASKANINFHLKINKSINSLINDKISKEKFETLIGDHLKDAIIAVNSSENSYKSILVILGMVEDCYEFSVYDTGIEFSIEVLLKLGLEPITTHKQDGGSGIGFMTTFETLQECKASLIIEEYKPETTNYTKSVTIRFDNKNEYRIRSYRAKEIIKNSKDNRIIIEKI